MKLNKLLFLTACLLLSGCKTDNTETDNNNNQNNTQENGNNGENNNGENTKPLDPIIANSKWGVEAATACYESIGTVIPYMEADAFEFEETEDNYGEPAIWFYLYYETSEIAESKIVDYAYAAYEQDLYECVVGPQTFQDPTSLSRWEQNVLIGDKVLDDFRAVEFYALDSIREYNGEGKPCLGIYCYNYIPNPHPESWPKYAVFTCIGTNDVPNFDNVEGKFTHEFSFTIESGMKLMSIMIKSDTHSVDMEELYFYMLLDKGYSIAQYDDLAQDYTEDVFRKGSEYPGYEESYSYLAYEKGSSYMVEFYFNLTYMALVVNFYPAAY